MSPGCGSWWLIGARNALAPTKNLSFIGHFTHATTVMCPGRIFLQSLFDLLSHMCPGRTIIHALQLCLQFLQVWSGMSFFPPSCPSHHTYSDASGSYGCGAFEVSSGWFKLRWPNHCVMSSITLKEFVPIVIAAAIWGSHWQGCHVCFHSNNMAVVLVLVIIYCFSTCRWPSQTDTLGDL